MSAVGSAVAAAVVGSAVIGAGAVVASSSSAARASNRASRAAIEQQQQALAQQERLAAPYTALGQQAMPAYQQLLGIGADGKLDPKLAQETLRNLPGYQFAQQEGQRGTLQAAGAMGMGLSGNTLAALDRYNTGLADQTYQDELRNLLAPVQLGQAAAAGQAANVGNAASNIGNIQQQQGVNLANIGINRAAGITNAIGQGVNQYVTQNTLQNLQGTPAGIQAGWNKWQDPTQFMNTPVVGGP